MSIADEDALHTEVDVWLENVPEGRCPGAYVAEQFAEWQASRKPEAAPSDTDMDYLFANPDPQPVQVEVTDERLVCEVHGNTCPAGHYRCRRVEVTDEQKALAEKASRHELRDQTFIGILERLREADDRDGPEHYVGNRAETAGDLYEAAREHFSQPVQVEVTDPSTFNDQVQAERQRQIAKGFTPEHDDKRGVDHLLMWAQEYARRGEPVKSSAMIEAAREAFLRLSAALGGDDQ